VNYKEAAILAVFLIGVGTESFALKAVAGLLFLGGLGVMITAKMLAWWNHS
jgi:hypothetical protein